jgi:hypothetical protein
MQQIDVSTLEDQMDEWLSPQLAYELIYASAEEFQI